MFNIIDVAEGDKVDLFVVDRRGVRPVQHPHLDEEYIARWAAALDVSSLWQRLKREAEPL